MLQGHLGLWVETNASTEDVDESSTLLSQSVDNRSTWWRERSLEHVAEHTEDAVEASEVLAGSLSVASLPLDASEHLGDQDEVDDQWRCKQGVLANIEERDGLVSTHEDLCIVLVKRTLVVSNSWHILDDDAVIWVLAWLVEDGVGSDHVIDDVGLGDLLGAELLLGAQVLAIVVAKVVVARDGGKLNTGVDQEVNKGRLHLGLARLEVVTANERVVLLSKLDGAWNEGVLWGTVDEWSILEDGSNSEHGGWGDLLVARLDGLEQVLSGVVDALDDVGITLGVGSPLDNNLVEVVGRLEVAMVMSEMRSSEINETYRMSFRICSTCSQQALEPEIKLSARSSWLAAMKSG